MLKPTLLALGAGAHGTNNLSQLQKIVMDMDIA